MNYTFEDMTTDRMDGGFALLDAEGNPIIHIYDFDSRKWVDGSFTLDTNTMMATKEGGRKQYRVDADLDQGIWFAA